MVEGTDDLSQLKGHAIICGWNATVPRTLEGLNSLPDMAGKTVVLVNQQDPSAMQPLRSEYGNLDLKHIYGPHHLEHTLRRAGAPSASAALLVADEAAGTEADNRTIICAVTVEKMNSEIRSCAELVAREQEDTLRRTGVDEIVIAGEYSGFFLSAGALAPGLSKAGRRLITFRSGSQLRRVAIPTEFAEHTVAELQEHYRQSGAMLLAIIREAVSATVENIFGGTDWIDQFITDAFKAVGEDAVADDREPFKLMMNPPDDLVLVSSTTLRDSAIVIGGATGTTSATGTTDG